MLPSMEKILVRLMTFTMPIRMASFFAACEGFSGSRILKLEEDIARTLSMDWKAFDVIGAIKL